LISTTSAIGVTLAEAGTRFGRIDRRFSRGGEADAAA